MENKSLWEENKSLWEENKSILKKNVLKTKTTWEKKNQISFYFSNIFRIINVRRIAIFFSSSLFCP